MQESRQIGSVKLGCNVCHPRGSENAGGGHPQHRHSVHSTLTFTLSSLEGGREGRTRRRSPRRHACDRSLAAERSRTVCEASSSLVAIPKHLHECACDDRTHSRLCFWHSPPWIWTRPPPRWTWQLLSTLRHILPGLIEGAPVVTTMVLEVV